MFNKTNKQTKEFFLLKNYPPLKVDFSQVKTFNRSDFFVSNLKEILNRVYFPEFWNFAKNTGFYGTKKLEKSSINLIFKIGVYSNKKIPVFESLC